MDLFAGLNPAQAEAVKVVDGPILILAGAGSGKTKTLTHRIAHLIKNHGVNSDEILALTFTNKAAREMRERLAKLLGRPNNWYFMPYMGTFHSICVKILRTSGLAIGIKPNFIIYDQSDREHLIKQTLKDLALTNQFKPREVAAVISSFKNKLMPVEEVQDSARGARQRALADLYQRYEKLRRAADALDFDDLLVDTVRLMKISPTTREQWRNQFRFILIDEYQDTNLAQYQLVRLLVNDQHNICVVGDDWQSIYSFRHADFTNILNFKRDFPEAVEIKLEQNYRSTGNILAAAQAVIEKNRQRSDKKIWTDAPAGQPVQVIPTNDESDEATRVALIVQQAVQQGFKFTDIAVLYRVNAQSYPLERAFVRFKIPHKIIGGVRFFDRKEIKDVVAYLRLAYQPSDIASFNRIVNLPARGLGKISIERFLAWQVTTDYDLVTALQKLSKSPLSPVVQKKFQVFAEIMAKLTQAVQNGTLPTKLIEKALSLTNYRQFIDDGSPEAEDRLLNLDVLINEAGVYGDLASFLEDASLLSSSDQLADADQVNLMTVHASKGLEFPIVIVVGMENETFPHARAYESEADMEEERRLCYVAMTRARQELYMTFAQIRFSYGGRNFMQPSIFLADFNSDYQDTKPVLSPTDDWGEEFDLINEFEVGNRVFSPQFGDGKVVDVDGLAVTVVFDDNKTRKLNIQYANLQLK